MSTWKAILFAIVIVGGGIWVIFFVVLVVVAIVNPDLVNGDQKDVTFLCEDGDLLSFGKDITEREIVEKDARLCQ